MLADYPNCAVAQGSHLSHGTSLESQGLKIMVQLIHRPNLWTDKPVRRGWKHRLTTVKKNVSFHRLVDLLQIWTI